MCSLGTYVWNFRAHEISKNPESWAHFGDYLGGIFSFFSFMALLYTVHLQIQELRATKEELKLSRQAQQESAMAQEQSAEVLRKQQFENTFFQLLNQVTLYLNKLALEKIDYPSDKPTQKDINDKISIIKYLYLSVQDKYDSSSMNLISYEKLYKGDGESYSLKPHIKRFQEKCHESTSEFPQFCLLVYQLLKLIKNSPYGNQDDKPTQEEKQYSNFLRAILTPEILQLMALYCYRQDEFSTFKSYQKLIERYGLFEHMPFHLGNKNSISNNVVPTTKNIYIEDNIENECKGVRLSKIMLYMYYKYDRAAFGDNETLKLIEPELKKISIE